MTKKRSRKLWKPMGLGLLVILIVIQFIPVDRSNPAGGEEIDVPDEVGKILTRSCYDCHSSATRRPWYASVAPVSWWVAHHVDEAREHFNFSLWGSYPADERDELLEEIWEEVEEGEMPPWFYLPAHPGARLSAAERSTLEAWVTRERGVGH